MTRAAPTAVLLASLGAATACDGSLDASPPPADEARSRAGTMARSSANAATPRSSGESELLVFVFDRSASVPDYTLSLAHQLVEERLEQLSHRDRVAAFEVLQRSRAEAPRRWSQSVPERRGEPHRDSTVRADFLRDANLYLAEFGDTTGRREILETDLLSTLRDVAEELRTFGGGRATVYLFSDMLQSNPRMDMEKGEIPSAAWVRAEAAEGGIPDLGGLCVVVVGARVDTERDRAVRDFWLAYLDAAGAGLRRENYLLRPGQLPADPCPEGPGR